MQIRHTVVEYDLEEAAAMLGISPVDLKKAVDADHLQCYYRRGKDDYRFHEASLRVNKDKTYANSGCGARSTNSTSASERAPLFSIPGPEIIRGTRTAGS